MNRKIVGFDSSLDQSICNFDTTYVRIFPDSTTRILHLLETVRITTVLLTNLPIAGSLMEFFVVAFVLLYRLK